MKIAEKPQFLPQLDPPDSSNDLLNLPQQHTLWVNVYEKVCGFEFYTHGSYSSEANADRFASADRVACVPVKFTV
jgi:hypothetical protein